MLFLYLLLKPLLPVCRIRSLSEDGWLFFDSILPHLTYSSEGRQPEIFISIDPLLLQLQIIRHSGSMVVGRSRMKRPRSMVDCRVCLPRLSLNNRSTTGESKSEQRLPPLDRRFVGRMGMMGMPACRHHV